MQTNDKCIWATTSCKCVFCHTRLLQLGVCISMHYTILHTWLVIFNVIFSVRLRTNGWMKAVSSTHSQLFFTLPFSLSHTPPSDPYSSLQQTRWRVLQVHHWMGTLMHNHLWYSLCSRASYVDTPSPQILAPFIVAEPPSQIVKVSQHMWIVFWEHIVRENPWAHGCHEYCCVSSWVAKHLSMKAKLLWIYVYEVPLQGHSYVCS